MPLKGSSHLQPGLYVTWIPLLVPTLRSEEKEQEEETTQSEKYFLTLESCKDTNAQRVLCKVYFSARPNKLRPILKFKKYYPIEHIFVPACSSVRKIHFFKF